MTEIIPAILAKDYRDLKEKLSLMAGRAPLVHLDVMDGTLMSASSWPAKGGNGDFERIKNEEEGLPYWEELNFEAHLMVKDVAASYGDWIRAGVERLIVHLESFETAEAVHGEQGRAASAFLSQIRKDFSANGPTGLEVGLAANAGTTADLILPHVLECDFIQLMAIKELGRQGETFDESVFDTIEKIKSIHPDTIISVDGGVSEENAERLIAAGVTRLVVGSAIFGSDDPVYALEDLQAIAE